MEGTRRDQAVLGIQSPLTLTLVLAVQVLVVSALLTASRDRRPVQVTPRQYQFAA